MKLNDAVIVVTGAGSGIGAAMATRFAAEQPRGLVLADIDFEAAARIGESIGGLPVEVDVAEPAANRRLIIQTSPRSGRGAESVSYADRGLVGVRSPPCPWRNTWLHSSGNGRA